MPTHKNYDNNTTKTTTTATTTSTTTTSTTTTQKPKYELDKSFSKKLKAPCGWILSKVRCSYPATYEHFRSDLQGPHETYLSVISPK